ncbi:EamA family transporter [Modestobacter sp. SSW1-42]|uniref:EamA family transporter n=1 Tax=Modestobacter sp. SSW1-42 TaxID=596372 RepID=UPI003987A18E
MRSCANRSSTWDCHPALIVLYEHVVLAAATSPLLLPALRRFAAAGLRTRIAVVTIGAGSSALATTAFTAAFELGDPITPQVLQKLQPLIALLLAAVLLGERLRRRFWTFAVPALVGAWLLAFPRPLDISVASAAAASLALGAAVLWAAGTVLGRFAAAEMTADDTMALRFAFGLVAMVGMVSLRGGWAPLPLRAVPFVVGLALVTGLLALALYYRALRHTPASRATLAELAFPVTAAGVGVVVLGRALTPSQWLGFVVVLVAVTAVVLNEHSARRPSVAVPDSAADALRTTVR